MLRCAQGPPVRMFIKENPGPSVVYELAVLENISLSERGIARRDRARLSILLRQL